MSELETQPRLAVLLSTFNGAAFLAEQLNSILRQTYENFILVVRDDGSTDDTNDILKKFSSEYPEKFHLTSTNVGNVGPCQSFAMLMQYVLEHKNELALESAYMMFSDQDDVWQQHKIETLMQAILLMDENSKEAALVHSDLRVVDEKLQMISESLKDYQGLQPTRLGLGRILLANAVSGCAVIANERLVRKALPVPVDAYMHDWWLAIIAGAFGQTRFLPEALVEYRQHGGNALGARLNQRTKLLSSTAIGRIFDTSRQKLLSAVGRQAVAFYNCHKDSLSMKQKLICKLCAGIGDRSAPVQKLLYRILIRL